MTPKHQTVLNIVGAVRSGLYLGSIKGRLAKSGVAPSELDAILRDLVADGLVIRKGEKAPYSWRKVPDS